MASASAPSTIRPLRFLMAGSVDDGKSTLTGRLLYDAQAILGDQLDKLEKHAAGRAIDFALLTDGLEAEREQGITIDVAYRYFSTKARKFIIADAPGHEQYTRNMVTAASGSDAAVILVDITKLDFDAQPFTLLPQTRRHTLLAQLLRVPAIVFAINKIDAVPNPREQFEIVRDCLLNFTETAGIKNVAAVVPISALCGDNVTIAGDTPWYDGPPLLEILETLPIEGEEHGDDLLIPVQYVARDTSTGSDMSSRVIWGRIARGGVKAGDRVQVFPSNEEATVAQVRVAGDTVHDARCGWSAGIVLDREIDVTRGNWISSPHTVASSRRFCATVAWMDTEPAQVGRKYLIRHGSKFVQGRLVAIESSLDIHTLERSDAHVLDANDIGTVIVETQEPVPLEPFRDNRAAGSMIVIDPATNHTSGVMLVDRLRWDFGAADGRASVRVACKLPVQIDVGDTTVTSTASNMSAGGLLVLTDEVLIVGGDVAVHFSLPNDPGAPIAARARVLAHQPNAGGGYYYHLAFFGVGPEVHERLAAFLETANVTL